MSSEKILEKKICIQIIDINYDVRNANNSLFE